MTVPLTALVYMLLCFALCSVVNAINRRDDTFPRNCLGVLQNNGECGGEVTPDVEGEGCREARIETKAQSLHFG